ncbi:MAG: EAL domain-containing protein, partial [Halioglobus sp.]|nr:EAL domain-containing protein [Halioglobus sp.]
MTVASKINSLVIAIVLIGATLFAAITIQREYSYARHQLIRQSYATVQSLQALPVALHFRDTRDQEQLLENLLSTSPTLRYAVARDTVGTPLAQIVNLQNPLEEVSFPHLRGAESPPEMGLTERRSPELPTEIGAIGALLGPLVGGDKLWDLTIPVFSLVNPLDRDVSRADYAQTLAASHADSSRHVVGYVHLGLSRAMLLRQTIPAVSGILALAGAFGLLSLVLGLMVARRISAPFRTLVKVADDVSAGRAIKTRGLEKNAEFRDIVALLNSIIGGLNTYKTQMDVDHQLLSMKVQERTAQLTRRNEELNQAVREVTQTRDRMRRLAYYDSLTALPNRRLFTEQLDLLLRLGKRHDETLGLIFIDLDNFKRINDSLGHSAGDLLLREVGKRLATSIRESDLAAHFSDAKAEIDVSRLGGDEFTVVLNRLDSPEAASKVAQRLLDVLGEPMTIEGHEFVITPSIGIAIAPRDADTVEELLKAADTAMYHAKGAGKNNFMFYSSDMDAASVERLTLENDLRKAIERNELVLHYQPQVDTETGAVIGAEALMRWEHPERGLVPPFKFIPLAEEMGLINAIGEWGLVEACRQMVELQAEGLDLPKVSVNVSALQFNAGLVRQVYDALARTGLKPGRLELELTEGIMMDGSESVTEALAALKELGVQLSIDDFGTGYSSLSYLSRFPLDELKIDRSFVVDLDKGPNDASLVVAIIAMARSLGLGLVAEGVETHEQY